MASQVRQPELFPVQQEKTYKRNVNIEACRRGGLKRAQQASFKAACVAGGKARAQQESFLYACKKGFAATATLHPEMLEWLKKRITNMNHVKGEALGLTGSQYRLQRIHETGAVGLTDISDFQ